MPIKSAVHSQTGICLSWKDESADLPILNSTNEFGSMRFGQSLGQAVSLILGARPHAEFIFGETPGDTVQLTQLIWYLFAVHLSVE